MRAVAVPSQRVAQGRVAQDLATITDFPENANSIYGCKHGRRSIHTYIVNLQLVIAILTRTSL